MAALPLLRERRGRQKGALLVCVAAALYACLWLRVAVQAALDELYLALDLIEFGVCLGNSERWLWKPRAVLEWTVPARHRLRRSISGLQIGQNSGICLLIYDAVTNHPAGISSCV